MTPVPRALTPERWQRVEGLYHQVLALPAPERAAAIVAACPGDHELAAQVQRLLDQPESAAEFLSTPAVDLVSPAGSTLVGQRIGVFEVQALLGVGGMGEVYRAQDTRLQRTVAIKILPREFTSDPERLARFEREARVLASLSHPNIGTLFDVQEADGVHALVLEFVEGETLGERIKASGHKGRASGLPLPEALSIAKQIADALEAAHEKGIVHRDLKPANIMITPGGAVKVLDFGLAKLGVGEASGPDLSKSPTATRHGTREGAILGTAAYMSPEQARGKAVDKRADIWAFGCVLYEMLTGRQAFGGETTSDSIAGILEHEPDWKPLPAATPPSIRRLLERCLTKDPTRRLRDIGDAALELVEPGPTEKTTIAPARAWPRSALAAMLGVALVAGLVAWAPWRPAPEPATPVRLVVKVGADVSIADEWGAETILSPDGTQMVFAAIKTGGQGRQLYVRRLDQVDAFALAGTEDAQSPFFSPNGQWLGFFAGGKLKKIAVTGGAAITLCDALDNRGGTWSEDGKIIFTPRGRGGLSWVSSSGGTPEVLTTPDPTAGTISDRWPQALPGGKAVLFTAPAVGGAGGYDIFVQALPKGPRKVLERGVYYARYVKSGHILYMGRAQGTLLAAPFDLAGLELTGPPVPVLEGVAAGVTSGTGKFALSDRGTLVFEAGPKEQESSRIDWMDGGGKTKPFRAVVDRYDAIHISPDGQRLAMAVGQAGERDVWVYDGQRDTMSRLTFDPGDDTEPVWTPDGRRIAFSSTRADKAKANIYWQRADGTGEAQRLTESTNAQSWPAWHPSGRFLAFSELTPPANRDIMILPIEGDESSGWRPGKPTAFLNSPFNEGSPAFSPDGKWLAYESSESGLYQLYVRPFPGTGGKWQVSTRTGIAFPVWSRTRKQLFWGSGGTIMAAPYAVEGGSFRAEAPRPWSPGRLSAGTAGSSRSFDLHPDGKRFAVLASERPADEKRDHVVMIQNFFEELRRLAPAKGSRLW